MSNEDDSWVDEVPQLLVGRLERRQVLRAVVGIQVSRLDPRKLGHVVDNLLLRRDVIVDERTCNLSGHQTFYMKEENE